MTSWLRLVWIGSLLLAGGCAPRSGSMVDQPAPQPVYAIPWNGSASIIEPPMTQLAEVIDDAADPDAAAATLRQRIADAQQQLGTDHATTQRLQLMLALVCEEDGRFDEARQLYERIEAAHRTDLAATSQPLADALRAHAIMELKAGNAAAALPLVNEAVAIYDARDRYGNALRTSARGIAAMAHAFTGDLHGAVEIHNTAVMMLPANPYGYRDRSVTLLIAGRWQMARGDLVKTFRFRQVAINDALGPLWLSCAAGGNVAMGDDALAQIMAQQPAGAPIDVNERIARYLGGEVTEDELHAAAATPYAWRDKYNRCLVAYFIAHRRRADGDDAGYRQWLTTCLNAQADGCWALYAAKREAMTGGG
jgi:tetratricopeptide (TPR) repeat protein